MTPHQATPCEQPRQDPFRWTRAAIATTIDLFDASESTSQRHFAHGHGVPRSTLGYWMRQYAPTDDDPVAAFFRSVAGEACLRSVVLAAFTIFHQRAAVGTRLIAEFLELSGLGRFVATSHGALQPLAVAIETDLGAFDDEARPHLAKHMAAKTIALTADENFHGPQNCLVAMEPVSNFLLVECYRDHRDAATWTEAIRAGLRDMPVQVVLLTSDLARGLLCCAETGLEVMHSPDLFHGQRDLLKPLLLPLTRPIQQATKDLEKARQHTAAVDAAQDSTLSRQDVAAIVTAVRAELAIQQRLEQAKESQEQAVEQVRGVADDYHPFDRQTGRPVTAAEVGARLNQHIEQLQSVVHKAQLGSKAQEALTKARTWLVTLMACVAWFWELVNERVAELELTAEQERALSEDLLPGYYWERAAECAREPKERKRLQALAASLQKRAWQEGGALASLSAAEQEEVRRVARESAGLFSRSSSCVEGRNGRLSLHHHGQGRLSERKLKALTVVHNYVVKRADGTTAAERFFDLKHKDVFPWLLERMPDLPRPAAKRRHRTDQGSLQAG
jgi:Family of unknown function (DUF6399)